MTVEEMIKKYESMVDLLEDEKTKDKGLWIGPLSVRQSAYKDIVNDLKEVKIIEHNQKGKIPQFVIELLESAKEESDTLTFFGFIKTTSDIGFFKNDSVEGEFIKWITKDGNEIELMKAWLYGYEVEEEPKYYVEEPLTGQFLVRDGNLSGGYRWADGFTTSSESYSEREIKSIDERYWPFAVPVEKEVAE